ncbi:hypothetical protein SynTAK9802_01015 [Synechococcus sp. TAK9802]|nr:hypothetical protein SynTAK9802_01015 [Synechococcus sp. TAK9802]
MGALLLLLMEIADLLLRRIVKKAYPHAYKLMAGQTETSP